MNVFKANYPSGTIYTCPICKKRLIVTEASVNIRCLVKHPDGSCCHYQERELNKENDSV